MEVGCKVVCRTAVTVDNETVSSSSSIFMSESVRLIMTLRQATTNTLY